MISSIRIVTKDDPEKNQCNYLNEDTNHRYHKILKNSGNKCDACKFDDYEED